MRVLVTGANGQVGRALGRCAPAGFDVVALDSTALDIANTDRVNEVVEQWQPQLIINAAAFTAVDRAEEERDTAWAVNQIGVENLARAAGRVDAALFHISTDYVFPGDATTPYKEADAVGPMSVYGASKLAGEQAALAALERTIILRTSWVFGSHGNNFVKTMIRLGREREELGVVADQHGCPTSSASIARCLWKLASAYRDSGSLAWGVYHFSGAPACTWYDFADAIFDLAKSHGLLEQLPKVIPITTREYPTPAKRPAWSVLDCSLIETTFGIAQPVWRDDLDQVIAEWIAARGAVGVGNGNDVWL